MPERPDLEYVVPILDRELRGRKVTGWRLKKPIVLRLLVDGKPEQLLLGKTFARVQRRAHFFLFELSDESFDIAVNPMLAGRFALAPSTSRAPGDLAFGLHLDDGRELRYRDEVQMGKVYLVRRADWAQVPGLAEIGIDVLSPAFTPAAFRQLARTRRDQAKVFLMDKRALDAFGNAYADEVLWAAQIHPKAMVRRLSDDDLDRLHDAMVGVLKDARKEIAHRRPPIEEKLRDFLNVRGRNGEACKRCGAKLRRARVHADDAIFCPQCQPDERGSSIVDWRKL